jgi:DUF1365 family protein
LADYWLDASNRCKAAVAKTYAAPEVMHVTPYVEMGLQYEWILTPPQDRLVVHRNTVALGQAYAGIPTS